MVRESSVSTPQLFSRAEPAVSKPPWEPVQPRGPPAPPCPWRWDPPRAAAALWPVFTQVAVGSLCSGKEPTWVFAWLSASWPVRLTRLTPRGVMLKLSQMRRARVTSHWPPRPFEPGHFPTQQVFQKLAPLPLLFWSQPPPPRALLPQPPRATTEPRGRGG